MLKNLFSVCLSAPGAAAALGGDLAGQSGPAVNNLVAWFKPDGSIINGSGVTPVDGETVDTWFNSAGSSYDLVQATDTNRPLYIENQINGYPVLRFDGTDNHMASAAAFPLTGDAVFTVFLICKVTETSGSTGIIAWGLAGANALLSLEVNQDATDQMNVQIAGAAANSTTTFTYDAFKALTISKSAGNLNPTTSFYTNGTLETTAGAATTPNVGSGVLRMGSNAALGAFCSMDIAEAIVYNAVLSADDRNAVHAYLASKYGLTIA